MPRLGVPREKKQLDPVDQAVVDGLRSFAGPDNPPVHMAAQALGTLTGPENPPVHMLLQALDKADPMGVMGAGGTPMAMAMGKIPFPHGTLPVKPGNVRLYHQTYPDKFDKIVKEGISIDAARGIEGPKRIYASPSPFYTDPRDMHTIEFQVPKGEFDSPFVAGTRRNRVPPEDFLAAHEPWHARARYWMDAEPEHLQQILRDIENPAYMESIGREAPLHAKAAEYIKALLAGEVEGVPKLDPNKVLSSQLPHGPKPGYPRLTEKRRDILFDRKPPANEPIRDLEHWEKRPMKFHRNPETEMMRTEDLKKYMEYDRTAPVTQGGNPGSMDNIKALEGSLSAYGAENPLMMMYWAGKSKSAILGEGNHRLAAALRAGVDELPVDVHWYPEGTEYRGGIRRMPVKIKGAPKDIYDTNLKPSEVNLPSRPLTPEEAALDGKILRIGYPEGYQTDAAKRRSADVQFSHLAGDLRDAEWARRNPPPPLEPGVQEILDLLRFPK